MLKTSAKEVAELPDLKAVPSNYYVDNHHNYSLPAAIIDTNYDDDSLIPIIDFSLLSSEDPHQHSKAIQDLGRACQHWGFFMVCTFINIYSCLALSKMCHFLFSKFKLYYWNIEFALLSWTINLSHPMWKTQQTN